MYYDMNFQILNLVIILQGRTLGTMILFVDSDGPQDPEPSLEIGLLGLITQT